MSNHTVSAKGDKGSKIAIIALSEPAIPLARTIAREYPGARLFSKKGGKELFPMTSVAETTAELFPDREALIFIGALGICTRAIAPLIRDKYTDPAVLCVDASGRFVIPVLSGHVGGANDLARDIARTVGGEAVVTTGSDTAGLWALDTLTRQFGWEVEADREQMNRAIFAFVNKRPTALLIETKDRGTEMLERTIPDHVTLFYDHEEIHSEDFELLIAVTPFVRETGDLLSLVFRPAVLSLGVGCRRNADFGGVEEFIREEMTRNGLSPLSIQTVCTIDMKKDEPLIQTLADRFGAPLVSFPAEELDPIETPSEGRAKVKEVTGSASVSEASAIRGADFGRILLPKVKAKLSEGNDFTFAVAINRDADRTKGHVEIVGAGPGDPELVSLRGKSFLERADLILYAGSLVPKELTYYAKPGATVRSSADMNLEEQVSLMKSFYDRGLLVVRLHTGDPSIYGAIQEQMALFDAAGMSYHITPGISSFQAAAAELKSEFTIPEKTQTIILTRGEGRTAMPEREKLHLLARSQSTMCIYLSALLAEEVQKELLTEYPPETPVAVCYKLTWKEQRIFRGRLDELAHIISENGLKLTTLIVVGEAIGNRKGLSRLYADEFKHLFRR